MHILIHETPIMAVNGQFHHLLNTPSDVLFAVHNYSDYLNDYIYYDTI